MNMSNAESESQMQVAPGLHIAWLSPTMCDHPPGNATSTIVLCVVLRRCPMKPPNGKSLRRQWSFATQWRLATASMG